MRSPSECTLGLAASAPSPVPRGYLLAGILKPNLKQLPLAPFSRPQDHAEHFTLTSEIVPDHIPHSGLFPRYTKVSINTFVQ